MELEIEPKEETPPPPPPPKLETPPIVTDIKSNNNIENIPHRAG
jgi:hypothetical protein